ncbi:hypothetical protein [uncultured Nostoc sp.]|uniref:hypothetical protein n=1 Tax=uncultured Nostoc sp. TaxID=340711 RepID=UPI0035C97318
MPSIEVLMSAAGRGLQRQVNDVKIISLEVNSFSSLTLNSNKAYTVLAYISLMSERKVL